MSKKSFNILENSIETASNTKIYVFKEITTILYGSPNDRKTDGSKGRFQNNTMVWAEQ
jgi:hypothetical protein